LRSAAAADAATGIAPARSVLFLTNVYTCFWS
jgi:hypothetical protein